MNAKEIARKAELDRVLEKRDHKEFVTSIHKEGYDIDMQTIKEAVVKAFENIFKEIGVYVNLLS